MIRQLMNKLGVEYGQKFSIGGMNTYEFTKDGLRCNDGGYNDLILREMVYGKITKKHIKKEPWKPKHGETYYIISLLSDNIAPEVWNDTPMDIVWYNNGLICKTKEEAEELRKYILEKIKDYKNQN